MSAPENLADFIAAEVARQSSEPAIRALVEQKIGQCIASAVDSSMRCFGHVGKQIEAAVAKALELSEPLDVPAYGTMVMAVLRQQMDQILTPLVNERLAAEMAEILSTAPAEVKLSAIIEAMKADEDMHDRFATHATLVIEESDNVPGYKTVFLDPEEDQKAYSSRAKRSKYDVALRFSVTSEGKIYSLFVDQKDAKTTIVMGRLPTYQRMVFAAYACGGKVIIDGDEGDFDTGYGDF
jgi:hypothetical protein